MVNQQVLEGHWNEIKGRLRDRWGQLTEEDFRTVTGNVDQLVGLIQQKTGESREEVERFLDQAARQASSGIEHAAEAGREYAQRAAETVQQATEHVSDAFRRSYSEAEAAIQRRPAESIAVAFGAGLVAGVVVGLVLRSR